MGLYAVTMNPANNLSVFLNVQPFGITQAGSPGDYTYSVTGDPNFPMNRINWASAARFVNWLANGQPTGSQGPNTTERGSYTLDGATADADLMAIARNPGATFVLPNEDEWYKAAYYKGGSTNAGYWLFPTQSNQTPGNELSTTLKNANYCTYYTYYTDRYHRLTPVSYFKGAPGPYDTFDQGGNVWQWNETGRQGIGRLMRGGSFYSDIGSTTCVTLRADSRPYQSPSYQNFDTGFRVVQVPEPTTLAVLALGSLLLTRRRRA